MRGGASAAAAPAPYADTVPARPSSPRSVALDVLRGLAVVLMVLDHLLIVTGSADVVRYTLTRAALPIFLLVSGQLLGSPRLRWTWIAALGVLVPVVVPWIDSPNVLLLWAAGALLVWAFEALGWPLVLLPVVGLTYAANHWSLWPSSGFDLIPFVGLMAVGRLIGRSGFENVGSRVPFGAVFALVGARPLSWYVGHLLVLQAAVLLLGAS